MLVGIPTLSVLLSPLYHQAQALERAGTLMGVLPAGRGKFIWATMSARAPWYYLSQDDHCLGTATDLAGFLDHGPEEGAPVWLGGELTTEIQQAVQHHPRLVALPAPFLARSPAVLARLAWQRWQVEPDCTDPAHLAPLYVSSQGKGPG